MKHAAIAAFDKGALAGAVYVAVRGLFGVLFVSELVTAAIACLRPECLKLGGGCVVCCMDLSITPQKGIPSQSNPT